MKELASLSGVTPFTHIHAHNDNEKVNPLSGALTKGIAFIEVDLWLKKGVLYAQHSRPYFINSKKKFTTLYLDPLFHYFKQNGTIFQNKDQPLTLVLDIKSDAATTYSAILQTLAPYQSMLTKWNDNNKNTNALSILLSGQSTTEIVQSQNERWVQVDGRISDIGKKFSIDLMPTISEKYSNIAGWHPFANVPTTKQLELIQEVADEVHAEGKLFRLWKIPEDKMAVELLLKSGVDIVSLDDVGNALK